MSTARPAPAARRASPAPQPLAVPDLLVDGAPVPAELVRSRRKTIALQVKAPGRVVVRAPLRTTRAQAEQFVREHAAWVRRQIDALARAALEAPATDPLSDEELADLRERARTAIPARVAHFAPIVGVSYGRITLRMQRTRWGSCSAQGNLNFNRLLVLAPPEVLDYVVVHELCHRIEMNHSPRFWAEVERVLPGYRDQRRWLKQHGGELMARACRA